MNSIYPNYTAGNLNDLHQAVLMEIEELADFCKACKPPKKKK